MNDKAEGSEFAYDRVSYPSYVVEAVAPDRLRAAGLLVGWRAPDPAHASVLEIGCGEGINLIAFASVSPNARAVGFDLATTAIERGRDLVARSGLTNVDLHVGDLLTYPHDGEKFDYITCHGVLTWVPEPVRQALLDLIAARLAPGGVAYISYDCLPGAAPKAEIVPFLRELTAGITDPGEAIKRGVQGIALLSRNQMETSRFKTQLDSLIEDIPTFDPTYFYHDWLAEYYKPVDLKPFFALMESKGLRIAGTVSGYELNLETFEEGARGLLAACGADVGRRLHLLELLHGGHIFHRDIFIRTDAPPARAPDGITELSFAFDGSREPIDTDQGPAIRYSVADKGMLTTKSSETIAVLDFLLDANAAEVSYGDILSGTGVEEQKLRQVLYLANAIPLIKTHATPQPFVLEPGERPRVTTLARTMLEDDDWVVTLRSARAEVPQPETQLCLKLCDGTRTRPEIAAAMTAELGKEITLADVEGAIRHFARRRVFEA